jgi:hypothetical protein
MKNSGFWKHPGKVENAFRLMIAAAGILLMVLMR